MRPGGLLEQVKGETHSGFRIQLSSSLRGSPRLRCLAVIPPLCNPARRDGRTPVANRDSASLDAAGHARALDLAAPFGARESSAIRDGLAISARLEHALGGAIVRATIANRGADPVRLTSAIFEVSTGFAPSAPARFFKHGYQSWSASGGHDVGASQKTHPRDTAHFITRLNHQSEPARPPEFPEADTSELFTIVESRSAGGARAGRIHRRRHFAFDPHRLEP